MTYHVEDLLSDTENQPHIEEGGSRVGHGNSHDQRACSLRHAQIQIKIYTILGRLVSQDTVGPGTFQFQVSTHGVYIVKIGQLTCKVAI